VPVVVGGIIPPLDAERLRAAGVAAVYTPKDFEINAMLRAIVTVIEKRFAEGQGEAQGAPVPRVGA
jgi:ethylmalonyl-CoA mutase